MIREPKIKLKQLIYLQTEEEDNNDDPESLNIFDSSSWILRSRANFSLEFVD